MCKIYKKSLLWPLILILTASLPGLCSTQASQENAAAAAFVDVAAGLNFSMALRSDGTVWCWGDNECGEVGDGTEGDFNWDTADCIRTKPYLVMGQVKSIYAAYNNCYAITKSNDLWVWGFNNGGRVGNGSTNDATLPVKILSDVKSIASGKANHSVAVKNDGSLWTWGLNMDGQIGDHTRNSRYTPFNAMKDVQSAAAGEGHTMAIKNNGDLYVWGRNWEGQLGDGTKKERMTPFKLMSNVRTATAGSNQSYFITKDGSLWVCGTLKPKKIMTGAKDISAGPSFYIITKSDGTLWACGENKSGTFGDGTVKNKSKPTKIMDGVLKAAAGCGHILVIKNDGTLWASGENDRGQLGTGDTKNRNKWVQIKDFPISGERAAIGSMHNSMSLDGGFASWKGVASIADDPAKDALPGAADLTALYGTADEKYLYIAVKALGNNPIIDLKIDSNGDGKEDYGALCYSGEKLAFLFENNKNGILGRIPVGYKQAVEFKIPLALIHATKNMQITANVSHNKSYNEEGDICKNYDSMDGWYRVPYAGK